MKGIIPLIPVAAILLLILISFFTLFLLSPVFEIVRIIFVILLIIPLVKLLSDYVANYLLNFEDNMALLVGVLLTIPILYLVYVNFFILLLSVVIIYAIFFIGKSLVSEAQKPLFTFTKWFKSERK